MPTGWLMDESCKDKKKDIQYNVDQECLKIIKLAFDVFGNRKTALRFVLKKHYYLNNVSLLKAIENGHVDRVKQLLHGIEHGIYL